MTAADVPAVLKMFRCMNCQTLTQRQPVVCAHCLLRTFQTEDVAATGLLASWTTVRKPPLRFKAEGAYQVAVVDLDNGMRISARLFSTPTDRLGDRVELVTENLLQTQTPTFKVTSHG
jgi:uncharacterized OB-fold protein